MRAAIKRVEEEVLRNNVGHCVEHAIAFGIAKNQREEIAELIKLLARSRRQIFIYRLPLTKCRLGARIRTSSF